MSTSLVRAETALAQPEEADFDFSGFRIFTSVPDHRDYGIVALRGMVIIYDERPLHCEGVIEGAFYVRESQHTAGRMDWGQWLDLELTDRAHRCGPISPLKITREVVQAVRWPRGDHWAVRLPSGFTDGPYQAWSFGTNFVGKVAGVYLPNHAQGER